MKQLRTVLLLLPVLLLAGLVHAQKKEVTGKVIDEGTGKPIGGANVLINKKKEGAITKEDGTYSSSVSSKATELIFSYVGYVSQTVSIGGMSTVNVSLVTDVKTNEEIVVIGYGTQKKSSVTGSIAKYKNEYLDEAPVSRLDQALQGRIAGVSIQNISSEAGAAPKVRIRGLSSVNAGADPLIVVDGHPLPDGLAFSNMGDVESIEVLKDAASTAIYGSRGASGVIIITTKNGKSGKPKYSFKFATGVKSAYKLYPVMTTTEYTNLLFYEASLKARDPGIPPLTANDTATGAERGAYVIEQTLMGMHSVVLPILRRSAS